MMTPAARAYIRGQIDGMVDLLRATHPSLTPGEIYDAIAQDLERRCRAVIDAQAQKQMGDAGPFNKGGE